MGPQSYFPHCMTDTGPNMDIKVHAVFAKYSTKQIKTKHKSHSIPTCMKN